MVLLITSLRSVGSKNKSPTKIFFDYGSLIPSPSLATRHNQCKHCFCSRCSFGPFCHLFVFLWRILPVSSSRCSHRWIVTCSHRKTKSCKTSVTVTVNWQYVGCQCVTLLGWWQTIQKLCWDRQKNALFLIRVRNYTAFFPITCCHYSIKTTTLTTSTTKQTNTPSRRRLRNHRWVWWQ